MGKKFRINNHMGFLIKDFIGKAYAFAHDAHDSIGQKRKYTGAPYWVHTDEVAAIVADVTDDPEVIAAAHLHDVLEDVWPVNNHYSPGLIADLFGERVWHLVYDLTDEYTKDAYPELNRQARKQKERERLGLCTPESQTIKLADLLSNSIDIVVNDANFAKTYMREKALLLTYLVSGDKTLWVRAQKVVEDYFAK